MAGPAIAAIKTNNAVDSWCAGVVVGTIAAVVQAELSSVAKLLRSAAIGPRGRPAGLTDQLKDVTPTVAALDCCQCGMHWYPQLKDHTGTRS